MQHSTAGSSRGGEQASDALNVPCCGVDGLECCACSWACARDLPAHSCKAEGRGPVYLLLGGGRGSPREVKVAPGAPVLSNGEGDPQPRQRKAGEPGKRVRLISSMSSKGKWGLGVISNGTKAVHENPPDCEEGIPKHMMFPITEGP